MRNLLAAVVFSSLIGYMIGMINPSYLIARRKGFDIRGKGSGNAGGSNALITMGTSVGVFCMLFDILKAYFCIRLTAALFPEERIIFPITAVGLIFGHVFPSLLSFRGGKGLACLGGILLAFSSDIFCIVLGIEVILLAITKYLCFVPITASLMFIPIYYASTDYLPGAVLLSSIPIVIVWKHRINLKRIKNGTEMRISYLWKKDEEWERVKAAAEKEHLTE